ncbi:MAG: hypothetical protein AABW85_05510, partial [archaeon]
KAVAALKAAGFPAPILKKTANKNRLKIKKFQTISYIETSDSIKKWLPGFLFKLLTWYKNISMKFPFLQFSRCIMEFEKQ